MKPLISIIIPTYNRAQLIGETLDSVIAQTYADWECIVVDDGSTDYTDELLEFYCERDSRIQYCHRPIYKPKGANACRNYGLERCNGEYIQWLDSDDLISENKFQEQIKIFNNESNISVTTCKFTFFANAGDSLSHNDLPYYKNFEKGIDLLNAFGLDGGFFPPHCYMVKRKILDILWNENLHINQDGDFFCRVLLRTKKVGFASNGIAYYRKPTGNNTSSGKTIEKIAQRINSWKIIEHEVRLKTGSVNTLYVRRAKQDLFKIIIKEHRILIFKNTLFFKKEIINLLSSKIFFSKVLMKKNKIFKK